MKRWKLFITFHGGYKYPGRPVGPWKTRQVEWEN